MKKIKIKELFFFFLTLLCSLQISYLIFRTHHISVLGIISILFFDIMFTSYLVFKLKKQLENYKLEKKYNYFIILTSTVLTILVISLNFNYFALQYKDSVIEIDTSEINSNKIIESIVLDNTVFDFYNNKFLNNGTEVDIGEIVIEDLKDNLVIRFDKLKNISINFKNKKGILKIKDGQSVTKLFLEDTRYYEVNSNTYKDDYFIIRAVLSFIAIMYIIYMLFVYIISIKNKSKMYFLITMISIILIGFFYFTNTSKCILYNDSSSYINFNFSNLFHLKLSGRTPVYPFIIRVFSKLFKSSYLYFVCIFQYLIWFISMIFLNKIFRMFFKKEKLISLFTILYALSSSIVGWNNIILTESLALSGTLIFLYYAIKYIKKPYFLTGLVAIIIAFVLTFHRPTSIIYVLFLEIFWIARFIFERKNIKIDFKCFIVSTISIILIVIYSILFHKTFGIFSISDAVVRQDLYVSISEGYYKSSNNKKFVEDIDFMLESKKNTWQTVYYILDNYTLDNIKNITNYCRKQNLDEYSEYIMDLIKEHTNIKYNSYRFRILNRLDDLLQETIVDKSNLITFFHSYLVIFIELILIVYNWIKNKKVPWLHFGILGMILVIVMSSFIGTCAEFMRTAICALPFTYFALALYIVYFFDKEAYLK